MFGDDAYRLYLERFERSFGNLDVGACAEHNGRVINKLSREEFEPKWQQLVELRATYENMLANGHTIDNGILIDLRDRAADLIVELPPQFA